MSWCVTFEFEAERLKKPVRGAIPGKSLTSLDLTPGSINLDCAQLSSYLVLDYTSRYKTMRETGTVISTERGTATVQFVPKEACEHCGAKGFCHPSPGKMTAEAVNSLGAVAGDQVVMETEVGTSMLAASLVFLVPVAGLVSGYLAARKIWGSEPAATAGAIVTMLISVVVLAYVDRKVLKPKRFMPRITEIVRRGVETVPKDPVCGMDVSQGSTLKTEYKGKTYYFCSESCRISFEKKPDDYVED